MFIHPSAGFQRVSGNHQGNPVNAPGTVITAGASNADGSWTQLTFTELSPSGSAAALRHDVHFIEMWISNNISAATDTSTTIEVGVDYAGGTSYTVLVSGIQAGFISNNGMGSGSLAFRLLSLPLWIPAGSTVAVRGRNVTGSTRSVTVGMLVHGDPRNPDRWWCGQVCDTLGYNAAASGGTVVAPNASANTLGSWVNFGSASTHDYGAIALSVQGATGGDTAIGGTYGVEIGVDSNQVGPRFYNSTSTGENCTAFLTVPLIFKNFPNNVQFMLRTLCDKASAPGLQYAIHAIR